MYSGKGRSGGGTVCGGEERDRKVACASSFNSLPIATDPLQRYEGKLNGASGAYSIRLQAKDILAELERSAGKTTRPCNRETDMQVSPPFTTLAFCLTCGSGPP
jgi:hypothetical protein